MNPPREIDDFFAFLCVNSCKYQIFFVSLQCKILKKSEQKRIMKYNLYIDECGDQNLANFDEQFPIFTLCGVVVADDKREWLEDQVHQLKQDFWGNQYTILHSRDIRKCQRGFEILFDLEVKKRFYDRVNAILGTKGIYTIVACSILKEPYIRYYGKLNDVYAQSLSFVLERTVFYLDGLSDNDVELHTVVEMRGKKEDDSALRQRYILG